MLTGESELLGLIYDAPFAPELWGRAMELLADEVSAGPACMTELDVVTGEGGGRSARVPDDTMATYVTQWAQDNPLNLVTDHRAYVNEWRLAIIRNEEWMDYHEFTRSRYFNDFLRPIASEHGMMIRLSLSGTVVSAMNIARSARAGAFSDDEVERARRWQGHLVRADRIGRQLRLDQAALDAVDRLVETTGKRLFFLDARGRVRRMSVAAEGMLASGGHLRVEGSMLAADTAGENARLQQLVAAATGRTGGQRAGGTMSLSTGPGRELELSITPLGPRSVASWSDEPVALVTLGDEPTGLPTAPLLHRQHGLTLAEARVALALAEGRTLREIADDADVSINTVRAQLQTIFSKTGCRRQADLVRLLLAGDEARVG